MKKSLLVFGCLVVTGMLASGAYVYWIRRSPTEMPIAARSSGVGPDVTLDHIPYYLQNDPTWASDTIGGSDEAMAAAGCTVTCTAMALCAIGYEVDPQRLNADLKRGHGFTDRGYIIWSALSDATGGKAKVRFPPLTYEGIDHELTSGRPVVAKIMLSPNVPHWVLIVGKKGTDYVVFDPLNGAKTPVLLSDRSSEIHAIRSIVPA